MVRRRSSGQERFCLAIGTAEPRKDLPGLVQAFAAVAERQEPDVALVLAGPPGWGEQALESAVAARVGDRIVRTGWLRQLDLAALLSRAAVLAFPSLYEGFGFPPLQAMRAGVPVVATRAGSLPEVLGDAALACRRGRSRSSGGGAHRLPQRRGGTAPIVRGRGVVGALFMGALWSTGSRCSIAMRRRTWLSSPPYGAPCRRAAPAARARRHRRLRPWPARRSGRCRDGGRRGGGGAPGQPGARRRRRSAGRVRTPAAHVTAAGPALDPGLGSRAAPRSRGLRHRALGLAGLAPAPAVQPGTVGRDGARRGLAPAPGSDHAARGTLARGGVASGQAVRRGARGPVPARGGRPGGDGHCRRPGHGGAERRRSSARARCRRDRCPPPEGGRLGRVPPHRGHARSPARTWTGSCAPSRRCATRSPARGRW